MSKPGAPVVSHAEQQTQRTAAGAGQSASVNEELTAQSEAMLHIVGRLTARPVRAFLCGWGRRLVAGPLVPSDMP